MFVFVRESAVLVRITGPADLAPFGSGVTFHPSPSLAADPGAARWAVAIGSFVLRGGEVRAS